MKKFLLCSLLLAVFASSGEAYRILCLFPFNGKSHHVMFDALCKGLAQRGHQIDMISHYPTKTPPDNYKDVVNLNGTLKNIVNTFTIDYARNLNRGVIHYVAKIFGESICHLMANEDMQKFIRNAPKQQPYDLILTEYFGSPCYIGFGPYLKTPVALVSSSVDASYIDEFIGNPLSYSIFPGIYVHEASLKSFADRLTNTLVNFVQSRLFFYYTIPQTELTRKYLGPDIPDVRELEKSVSLLLVNTHHSFHGVRPITPALIPVGGLHVEHDKTQLTQELKAWLDSAKDGVVYFTLGSMINIETLPKDQLLDLYSSFSKIAPIKVLMKCADRTKLPPGLPSNIHTLPWIPQIPVLKHKNIKLFITHGGLMGSMEALHFGVPMIGIPCFADQYRNINIFVEKGMAIKMTIDEINKKTMDRALDLLLNDPKYMEAAKRESALFRDRPMNPTDTANYWIEYVIRNGPNALKSPALELTWWQLYLLDVYAFLICCVALILSIIILPIKFLIRCVSGTKVKSVSNGKKRN